MVFGRDKIHSEDSARSGTIFKIVPDRALSSIQDSARSSGTTSSGHLSRHDKMEITRRTFKKYTSSYSIQTKQKKGIHHTTTMAPTTNEPLRSQNQRQTTSFTSTKLLKYKYYTTLQLACMPHVRCSAMVDLFCCVFRRRVSTSDHACMPPNILKPRMPNRQHFQ